MMACCIIAAMVLAQIMATVRKWGVFWGVVRPYEGEEYETVYQLIGGCLRRPRVRAGIFAVAAIEFAALGAWVYYEHGTHFYQLGDEFLSAARGEYVFYADVCGEDGVVRATRIAVERPRLVAFRAVLSDKI